MVDIREIYGIRNGVKKVKRGNRFFTVQYLQDTQGNDQTGNIKVFVVVVLLGVCWFF